VTTSRRPPRRFAAAFAAASLVACWAKSVVAIEFNGYFQAGAAVRTAGAPEALIYNRQMANFKIQATPYDRTYLRLEADVWNDVPSYEDGHSVRSRIREAYARYRFRSADLTVGRQQIAWGQADGIIVADQVSPFDLENFIIPKFDEIRLGVDAVQLTYHFQTGRELDLVYIAQFQPPDFPEEDSPWRFVTDDQLDRIARRLGIPVPPGLRVASTNRPSNTFEHSEGGIRFKNYGARADWAVGYLYSWDDRPFLRIDPFAGEATPTHKRYHLVTATVVAPVGAALLKAESALELDRHLNAFNAEAFNDGFVSKENVWRTLLGADFKPQVPYWEQPDLAFQFIVDKVFSPDSGLAQEEDAFLASVRISAAYLNETVKPWILLIGGLNGDNTWLQARLDYEPIDNWKFTLEGNFFFGHAYDGNNGGIYGSFDDNDLIGVAIRWSF
jgi:hypothetical protein